MKIHIIDNYREIFPDKKASELTDALIIKTLASEGYDTSQIVLTRTEKGKPLINCDDGTTVFLSVSHCQDTFACILSNKECGIDIQNAREVSVSQIASRYFTEEEREYIDKNGTPGFFVIWTRREAYAKYTGEGIRQVMGDVTVLGRKDVIFEDSILENGMYCSICY